MPLLDFYIMVDWSGEARRRGGRSDTIWIAHGLRTSNGPLTHSPHSRTEAIQLVESILDKTVGSKQRALLCFDFAYGYPVDFAAALQAVTGKSDRDSAGPSRPARWFCERRGAGRRGRLAFISAAVAGVERLSTRLGCAATISSATARTRVVWAPGQ
jgi:hypothetical protein